MYTRKLSTAYTKTRELVMSRIQNQSWPNVYNPIYKARMLTGLTTINAVRTMKAWVGGGRGIAPLTLNLRSRWRWSTSCFDRLTPKSWNPRADKQERNLLVMPRIESWLTGRPVGSQVNVLTELPRIPRTGSCSSQFPTPLSVIKSLAKSIPAEFSCRCQCIALPGVQAVPQIQTACIK